MWWTLSLGGLCVVAGLGWYAWLLIRQVRVLESEKAASRDEAAQSIVILIGSYLDAQVDRSECLLRIRVLLDGRFPDWTQQLSSQSLLTVSDQILAMPYGEARAQLDGETRKSQDGARRQLLQMHERELARELTELKEWITQ
jgi:hypothetical protein